MQLHDPSVQSLVERVAKLEDQNRWLRKAGVAALVGASAMVVMGQARTSRVLEANEFILKDDSGTVRARLSVQQAGPMLAFYRDNVHVSASLIDGDEPLLYVNRAGRGQRILIDARKCRFQHVWQDRKLSLRPRQRRPQLRLNG